MNFYEILRGQCRSTERAQCSQDGRTTMPAERTAPFAESITCSRAGQYPLGVQREHCALSGWLPAGAGDALGLVVEIGDRLTQLLDEIGQLHFLADFILHGENAFEVLAMQFIEHALDIGLARSPDDVLSSSR